MGEFDDLRTIAGFLQQNPNVLFDVIAVQSDRGHYGLSKVTSMPAAKHS
jgi:hypothetical protein